MIRLTDLEHAVLGVVWRDGPCTPYAVRKEFLDSPTPSWSGSAGTIYPLVRRLERAGLLASEEAGRDRRPSRLYRVTASGRRVLRDWLRPPLPVTEIAPGADPIRTRLFFLDALPPDEREAFLDMVVRQLEEHVADLRGDEQGEGRLDPIDRLARRGVRHVAEARLRWLREVRATLGRRSP